MEEEITSAQSLSVGEVDKQSGLPVSTLHFYESKGLLIPRRSAGNQRVCLRAYFHLILQPIRTTQKAAVSVATEKATKLTAKIGRKKTTTATIGQAN
ncbi:Redox-sensitive transcriptional activator SoxR [compost metagenome]